MSAAAGTSSLPAFVARRLFWMLLTTWAVYTVAFFLMRAVPGGPFDRERQLEPHVRANLEARYNLDKPVLVQYGYELRRLVLHGDFGLSFRMGDFSVARIIAEGLPVSAALGSLALAFALLLGVPAGTLAAVRRGKPADAALMALATLGIALPNFVLASAAVIVFAFFVPLFPPARLTGPWSLVLPALCLGAPYAAYIARLTRTGMLDVLGQDYIRTAYAKGLPPSRVVFKHALRTALLPTASFLGPATAGLLTGSLVIEQIFALPGLGAHFVQSALLRDYTVSLGLVTLYTVLLSGMNLLVDLLYAVLDPRVKLE